MDLHPAVSERLAGLAPDQRAAATAAPGPVLCVAPAGSGKTTTLVARVAWRVATGTEPEAITVLAFNRRAAEELSERLSAALSPLGVEDGVRVRTFHALGLEVLREAGHAVQPLVDRDAVLRELFPEVGPATRTALDLAISRLKLDACVSAEDVAADPTPGDVGVAFVRYEQALAARGALDFDDLVARALRLLRREPAVLATWRARCRTLFVDEAQDLDRSQLELALLLAAPGNDLFLVGDDDQTIYGWRLADVQRILGLDQALSDLRRVDLTVNYRCPAIVVERAVRLVEVNRQRFAKRIVARPGAPGRLVLAPDAGDDVARIARVVGGWTADGTRAILARTNRELLTAAIVALHARIPFRAAELSLLVEDERVDGMLAAAAALPNSWPLLVRMGRVRSAAAAEDREIASAVLGWAAAFNDLGTLRAAVIERRASLAELRRPDAALTLATAHATKGAEWDDVLVLADGFPATRAIATAEEPEAILEEERRLAYVAWTRARRSLTLLFDPANPSPFLLEAFDPDELGLEGSAAAA